MSKTRTKKLRKKFEEKYGFNSLDRDKQSYKQYWRRYKKAMQIVNILKGA